MKPFRSRWDKPSQAREVIYRDKANGTIEHFTNVDGQRYFVARSWAEDQVGRGYARFVDLWKQQ